MRMGRLVTRMLGGGCAVFLCAAATAFVAVAHAQDTYAIGVSGALTGPPASINAPPIEGLRLYVDRLNSLGGINGKRVRLSILDDQAEPSKAAANAKRLLTPGQCHPADPLEPVVDLCAGSGGDQAGQRTSDVHGSGVPEGGLPARRAA